jgi:hypothetical protein
MPMPPAAEPSPPRPEVRNLLIAPAPSFIWVTPWQPPAAHGILAAHVA